MLRSFGRVDFPKGFVQDRKESAVPLLGVFPKYVRLDKQKSRIGEILRSSRALNHFIGFMSKFFYSVLVITF